MEKEVSGHYLTLKKSLLIVTQRNRPLRYFSMTQQRLNYCMLLHNIHRHKQTDNLDLSGGWAEVQPPDQYIGPTSIDCYETGALFITFDGSGQNCSFTFK